jgi:hypothetical protein
MFGPPATLRARNDLHGGSLAATGAREPHA